MSGARNLFRAPLFYISTMIHEDAEKHLADSVFLDFTGFYRYN
jgi:hypothetical protein